MSGYNELFEAADQFIELANRLSQEDSSGTVGAAIRYAAARYNAFEASMSGKDIATEKQQLLDSFGNDYRQMLSHNLDEHIG